MADRWAELLEANRRNLPEEWPGVPAHHPHAVIVCCSDARVPPSTLFDQPAGSLFVVRIAGNTADPAVLASVDYAVGHLGVDLVVVLGHTECGAVGAAMGGACAGEFEPITGPICDVARNHPGAGPDEISARNAMATAEVLRAHPGLTGQALAAGRARVEVIIEDLRTGRLVAPDSLIGDSSGSH